MSTNSKFKILNSELRRLRLSEIELDDTTGDPEPAPRLSLGALSEGEWATVSGTKVHRSYFAYVGDPKDKSTWKLPIHDAAHVRNALARFNQADIPAEKKKEVARKVVNAAKKYKIDTSGFEEKYLSDAAHMARNAMYAPPTGIDTRGFEEKCLSDGPADIAKGADVCATRGASLLRGRHIAVLLAGPGRAVEADSYPRRGNAKTRLHEIPIALTGTWVKGERKFSITRQDLADMLSNFAKRKNEQVVIDYEHASEVPEVARGGPVPAAGWIHALSLVPSANGRVAGGARELKALVEWTPDAEEMIRKGQYRFFSPAIDWSARDKETGEPQGATLTSGALTNHPFLEELPPIMLTDLETQRLQEMAGIHQDGYIDNISVAPGRDAPSPGGKAVRQKLSLKKFSDRGKRVVCDDGGEELGEISLDELDLDDAEFEDLMSKRGAGASAGGAAAMLSETLRDGTINLDIAAKLADQGRIGFSDFRAVQKAQSLVERAIADGKFLPADREFISRLALTEPERFEAWTRKKPRAIQLGGPTGVGGSSSENPAQELSLRLNELMREKRLSRQTALQELAQTDPELIRRWRWGESQR